MNKDQAKGAVKDVTGKVQQKFGKVIGNKKLQVKGIGKQIEGKAQKAVGNAKEDIEDAAKGRW